MLAAPALRKIMFLRNICFARDILFSMARFLGAPCQHPLKVPAAPDAIYGSGAALSKICCSASSSNCFATQNSLTRSRTIFCYHTGGGEGIRTPGLLDATEAL